MAAPPSSRHGGVESPHNSTALRVEALHKAFPSGRNTILASAVDDVWLQARSSEIVAICGGTASGKTTLLRCISGLMRADSGRIFWFGARFKGGGCLPGLVYLPNAPDYYPFLTVRDALEYHVDNDSDTVAGREVAIAESLRSVGLRELADVPVAQLGRSRIASLAVAEALASAPRAIVIDCTLDCVESRELLAVQQALLAFAAAAGTVLVASRRADIVRGMASRILWIDRGAIIDESAPVIESECTPGAAVEGHASALLVAERMH